MRCVIYLLFNTIYDIFHTHTSAYLSVEYSFIVYHSGAVRMVVKGDQTFVFK